MQGARAAMAILALLACSASAVQVSPVQKVIELLEENKAKIASDLAGEEKEMEEYSVFCDDEMTAKGYAIKDSTRTIGELEAAITDGEGVIQERQDEVAMLGTEMAATEKELAGMTATRQVGKEEFGKNEKELLTSIDELERAVAEIKKSAALVQTGAAHKRAQLPGSMRKKIEAAMLAVSRIVDASFVNLQNKRVLKGLLQTTDQEASDEELTLHSAPEAKAFESATGGITEKLEEMKEKAEESLSDARNGELKEQHSFDMMAQSHTDALKVAKDKLAAAKSEIEASTEEVGKAKSELMETEKTKAADIAYVATLSKECSDAKDAWAARQASAKEEMAVIEKAKGILADRVKAFVQVGGKKAAEQAVLKVEGDNTREADARNRVVGKLQQLSRQFHSYALMEMVTAAGADPFEKIRGLISEMITKLTNEANQEATQKAFCDEEMGKSKEAKEEKTMKADTLQSRLDKATSTKAELEGSIKELEAAVAELDAATAEATKIRGEEHTSYLKASKDFKDSAEAVTEAISVLKEYYEGALVQTGAKTTVKAPTFGGAKGDAASSIMSILEMSAEDFTKLYMEEEQAEAEAAEKYKKLMDESATSKAAKLAEVKGAESEIKSLEVALQNSGEDLSTVNAELEAIESYMDKLKPQCESKAMSYEEKKSRREAEISGLKEALTILEGAALVQTSRHLRHAVA